VSRNLFYLKEKQIFTLTEHCRKATVASFFSCARHKVKGELGEMKKDSSWKGSLSLDFGVRNSKTVLTRFRKEGPLAVQRLFYPEKVEDQMVTPAHGYILHPPGGLVSGDELFIEIELQERSHALITTPAATKVYRAKESGIQRQRTSLKLSKGAALEYLPQETIVFSGARAEFDTTIELEESKLVYCSLVCLGRPEAGETFALGSYKETLCLSAGGQLLLKEHFSLVGEDEEMPAAAALNSPLVLGGYPVSSLFIATGFTGNCETLKKVLLEIKAIDKPQLPHYRGASLLGSILVARSVGPSTMAANYYNRVIWKLIRPHLFQREAVSPRIWRT
jgi:urease accessory protein